MERHRIAIVIPALNEKATIAAIVASASGYGTVVVVDDGSGDETGALAAAAGATVVRHDVNRGYDAALNSGFSRASEMNCAYVVTMDADGQHDPTRLLPFIRMLDEGADVVVGIRDRRQRLAEHVFAWMGARKWGIHDPLCGMKAYRMAVYRELGHFDAYASIGTELAIFAASSGKKIMQCAVQTSDRNDQPRFGRTFSANMRILHALWVALRSGRHARQPN
jgi:glycosyltransferase involved in cell wall biosynthesis